MTEDAPTPYDQVIYPGNPVPQSHPDRLATLAALYGMRPAPVPHCRVLELGCGIGGNLTALACQWPDSAFVGIDLSARSIEIGQRNVAELELRNLTLRHYSIMDVTPDFGTFDYIIAHGVYSWVPAAVREQMLGVFKQNLAPQGVAYVSYNAYPGSHFRNAAREMMLYHVRAMDDPQQKIDQGRALIKILSELIPPEEPYGQILREQYERLRKMADEVVYHDDLDPDATPFLFHQVVEGAERHGLQYLSEANFAQSHRGVMPDYITRLLRQFPVSAAVEREQYLDFFASRSFRQTLLCHGGIALRTTIEADCIKDYYLAGYIVPEAGAVEPLAGGVAKFKNQRGVALSSSHPLTKAALLELGERWPQAVRFPDLLQAAVHRLGPAADATGPTFAAEVDTLTAALFRAFSTDQIELHLYPPRLTTAVSERPQASLLARKLAEIGPLITNLRHTRVTIEDEVARRFLRLVDGTRDIDQLVFDLKRAVRPASSEDDADAGRPAPEVTRASVERNLKLLGSLGLLEA